MRLLRILLLASLITAGPVPQKSGMVHHHHLHHKRDDSGLFKRDSTTTSTTSTSSTSSTSTSTSTSKTTSSTSTTSKSSSATVSATTTASSDSTASSSSSDAMPGVTSSESSSSSSSSETSSASSDSMPSVTSSSSASDASSSASSESSSSSTTSYYYSIAVPPSTKSGSYDANPYIHRESQHTSLVFIIMGGVLGLIIVSLVLVWFVLWLVNRSRAKNEREVYTGSLPGGGFFSSQSSFLMSDGGSSICEKSSMGLGSNSSVLMLHRQQSALNLDAQSQQPLQGRTYRDMQGVEQGRRGSMFVSPVLEMMHGRSRSQISLLRPESLYGLESYANSPIDSPVGTASNDAINVQPLEPQEKKKQRPPSQVLDDLLGDSLDITWETLKNGGKQNDETSG